MLGIEDNLDFHRAQKKDSGLTCIGLEKKNWGGEAGNVADYYQIH